MPTNTRCRPLALLAVLTLVLVGLAPAAAHGAGELVGSATRADAVPLYFLGPLGGSFRASNVGIDTPEDPYRYVDTAWYSFTPPYRVP